MSRNALDVAGGVRRWLLKCLVSGAVVQIIAPGASVRRRRVYAGNKLCAPDAVARNLTGVTRDLMSALPPNIFYILLRRTLRRTLTPDTYALSQARLISPDPYIVIAAIRMCAIYNVIIHVYIS
jgi:hypothetical protein